LSIVFSFFQTKLGGCVKITASLLLLFAAVACFGNNQHGHVKRAQKGHAMIMLPTMQCDTCVKTIKAAVEKVQGVDSVSIDLKMKMAHVHFDPAKTSQENIEKAIAAAGYDANNVKRDEKAHALLPKCCQSKRD
jgi:periplasmic mercuric ion binding protein